MDKSQGKCIERFGPVPTRVITDTRFTLLDLKVLVAVACHDQFNRNGRGCYASHKRLAVLIGAHPTSIAKSIARLIAHGYISSEKQKRDGRLRIYFVVYNAEDEATFLGRHSTHQLPRPKQKMVSNAQIDGAREQVSHGNHSQTQCVIYSHNGNINKIDSLEGALSEKRKSSTDIASLGRCDRIQEKIDTGVISLEEGVKAFITEGTKAKKYALNSHGARIDGMIDAAISNADEQVANELMCSDAKPSAALLSTPASLRARSDRG